jgi:hypothetical protein
MAITFEPRLVSAQLGTQRSPEIIDQRFPRCFPQCFRSPERINLGPRHWGMRIRKAGRFPRPGQRIRLSKINARDTLAMSEQDTGSGAPVRVPFMQRVLDNPFILLFVGIVFPAVFYIIWGIMEIVNIPIAQ